MEMRSEKRKNIVSVTESLKISVRKLSKKPPKTNLPNGLKYSLRS